VELAKSYSDGHLAMSRRSSLVPPYQPATNIYEAQPMEVDGVQTTPALFGGTQYSTSVNPNVSLCEAVTTTLDENNMLVDEPMTVFPQQLEDGLPVDDLPSSHMVVEKEVLLAEPVWQQSKQGTGVEVAPALSPEKCQWMSRSSLFNSLSCPELADLFTSRR
jgi:hypothetical protein